MLNADAGASEQVELSAKAPCRRGGLTSGSICVSVDVMRTTLDIDSDVLQAAKEVAARRGTTVGRLLSDWARQALALGTHANVRNGVPLLASRSGVSKQSLDLVNRFRDEP